MRPREGGSSRKISDINSVIDGIAFRANVLALDAASEAAPAKAIAEIVGPIQRVVSVRRTHLEI